MPRRTATTWATWLIPAALFMVAFALRLPSSNLNSLWMDELSTAFAVSQDLAHAHSEIVGDVHPPLYTFAVLGWVGALGFDEASLKLSAVVFGAVTVPIAYLALARSLGRHRALACALVVLVLPRHVVASWELRVYALGLGLGFVYVGVVLAGLRREGRDADRAAVVHGLVAALLMYTHYAYSLLIVAGVGALALWGAPRSQTHRGARLRPTGIMLLTSGLAFAPWLPTAVHQLREGDRWIPPADLARVQDYVHKLFANDPWEQWLFALGLAFFVIAGIAALRSGREYAERYGTVALLAFVPPTLAVLISWIPGAPSMMAGKTGLLWSAPLFVALVLPLEIDEGDSSSDSRRLRMATLATVVGVFVASAVQLRRSKIYERPYRPDNRAAAEYIVAAAGSAPERLLVMTSHTRPELFDFYLAPHGLQTHASAWRDEDIPVVRALLEAHPDAYALVYVTGTNRPSGAFLASIGEYAPGYRRVPMLNLELHHFLLRAGHRAARAPRAR